MPFLYRKTAHPAAQSLTTTALMLAVYVCYCAIVRFATSEGAGWQFFLLAFSSAIPALAFLCMLNAMYLTQWGMKRGARIALTVALDVASIALIASQVDYQNMANLEF